MRTPTWKPQPIYKDSEFSYVLSFEEEHTSASQHFIGECDWSKEDYKGIANFYWFTAKITAYKGSIECGNAYLGACCYKNLKDVMGTESSILGGYAHQMIEEAKDEALANLSD